MTDIAKRPTSGTASGGGGDVAFGGVDVSATTPLPVTGNIVVASANFTRPSDTTAYALGDLVANSVTAGSVVAMSWTTAALASGGTGFIRRARLTTSSTSTTNALFRLYLFLAQPTTITNGDNAAFSTSGAAATGGFLGTIELPVLIPFTDCACGNGVPTVGNEINFDLSSGTTIFGLLQALAAYTPTSAGTFTIDLEIHRY